MQPNIRRGRRRVGRLAVVLAAVLVVGIATTGTADAAYNNTARCGLTQSDSTGDWHYCGYAVFKSEVGDGTEQLILTDANADGHGVVVVNYRYDLSDVGPYYGWFSSKFGESRTWTLHIPEGSMILFQVCAQNDHLIIPGTCGGLADGQA
jgi:hypothetical protein